MKKLFTLLLLSIGFVATTQEKFVEGIITMKQTMSSPNEQVSAMLASIGEMQTTTYVDGAKSRTESSNPMSGDVTIVIDANTNEMLQLMDVPGMGKKFISQKVELTEEMKKNIKITESAETKTILGYECKKVTIDMNQNGNTSSMDMFITDKIKGVKTQQTAILGDEVVGFPLYMVIRMNQMGSEIIITSEVIDMVKQDVDDSKFSLTPPEGYTKMQ